MKGIELFILISVILNVVLVIVVAIIAHFLRKAIIKLQSIEITQNNIQDSSNNLYEKLKSIDIFYENLRKDIDAISKFIDEKFNSQEIGFLHIIDKVNHARKEDLNKFSIDFQSAINNEIHQSITYIKEAMDPEIMALKSTISQLEKNLDQLYKEMNTLQEKMHSYQMRIEDLKDFLEKPINIEEYLKGGDR